MRALASCIMLVWWCGWPISDIRLNGLLGVVCQLVLTLNLSVSWPIPGTQPEIHTARDVFAQLSWLAWRLNPAVSCSFVTDIIPP